MVAFSAQATLLLLEAVGLVVLGAVGHVIRAKVRDVSDILDNLLLAVVAGVVLYSMLGEPTTATVVMYMAAGYSGGEALDWLLKPWWNKPEAPT